MVFGTGRESISIRKYCTTKMMQYVVEVTSIQGVGFWFAIQMYQLNPHFGSMQQVNRFSRNSSCPKDPHHNHHHPIYLCILILHNNAHLEQTLLSIWIKICHNLNSKESFSSWKKKRTANSNFIRPVLTAFTNSCFTLSRTMILRVFQRFLCLFNKFYNLQLGGWKLFKYHHQLGP